MAALYFTAHCGRLFRSFKVNVHASRSLLTFSSPSPATVEYEHKLNEYANFNPTPMSIANMLEFSREKDLVTLYNHLRCELPVRMSNMIKEMSVVPAFLKRTKGFKDIKSLYDQTMCDLLKYEVHGLSDYSPDERKRMVVESFAETLQTLINRHANVIHSLSDTYSELRAGTDEPYNKGKDNCMQYFTDRFLGIRISMRLPIQMFLSTFYSKSQQTQHGPDDFLHRSQGVKVRILPIMTANYDVIESAQRAFENTKSLLISKAESESVITEKIDPSAREMILRSLRIDVRIIEPRLGRGTSETDLKSVRIPYVNQHLDRIFSECLANAMEAVVKMQLFPPKETRSSDTAITFRLVDILVDIITNSMKTRAPPDLSDRGIGMPIRELDQVFRYSYSTKRHPITHRSTTLGMLSGGFGLPVSRLYIRYLGGDIKVVSTHGKGTSVFLYFQNRPERVFERVPVCNSGTTSVYGNDLFFDKLKI
ncbi:hypothetical protein ACOME3_007212 [Neoechinorhynchus agilis]